ncbi:unnamed protein product [Ambrosiozyma monospora]|uniref:Unnamed protein product n=1 Tax=Ambrosiozyma monospora TaxID=43982 RepID=A0ACB5TVH0_AMBMO|nr:unnamed protein product [Ambrosiozyma monospora]
MLVIWDHTDLEKLISNNKDILTTSIEICADIDPDDCDIFLGLANCCDTVKIKNFTKDDVEWINDVLALENLTTCCPPELSLKNKHLKTLCLMSDSLDASMFDTIPDTLQSIELKVKSYDLPSFKLPLSLRKLTVSARKVPQIINVKELASLTHAEIKTFAILCYQFEIDHGTPFSRN